MENNMKTSNTTPITAVVSLDVLEVSTTRRFMKERP